VGDYTLEVAPCEAAGRGLRQTAAAPAATPSVGHVHRDGAGRVFIVGNGLTITFSSEHHPVLRSPDWALWKKARLSTALGSRPLARGG